MRRLRGRQTVKHRVGNAIAIVCAVDRDVEGAFALRYKPFGHGDFPCAFPE